MHHEDAPSITFQTSLPLTWELPGVPGDATLAQWRHGNIVLLRALATMESVVPDKEREADQAVAKAVERIEAKVDIMLGLLAQLIIRQTDLPPACMVTLAAQHVEWPSLKEAAPPQDSPVLLKLYLSPKLPEPLKLWVRVAIQPDYQNADYCHCMAQFIDQDTEFDEWMTRTLFRYHRRALQARYQQ